MNSSFEIFETIKNDKNKVLTTQELNTMLLLIYETLFTKELDKKLRISDTNKQQNTSVHLDLDVKCSTELNDHQETKSLIMSEPTDFTVSETILKQNLNLDYIKKQESGISILQDKLVQHPVRGLITICSSVATTGNVVREETDYSNTSGMKAALFGSADDAQSIGKLFMSLGKNYLCKGNYVFSQDSINSVNQENFMSSLRNYFNSSDIDLSIIYYSGHGFPDATILFETSQGNYHVSYYDIVECWNNRSYPNKNKYLLLLLDCCFSGSWVRKLLENGNFKDVFIQASSTESQKSLDMGQGKGSLYTNCFIWANLRDLNLKKGTAAIKSDFNFEDIEETKLVGQVPRGICFDDIQFSTANIKGINANSWKEIKESKYWDTWTWNSVINDKINQLSIKKYSSLESKHLFDSFTHLLFCFKDQSFSGQGEFCLPDEGKILIRFSFITPEAKKQFYGFSSIYLEEDMKTLTGKYFNHACSKKVLTFERSSEEVNEVIDLISTLVKNLLNGTSSDVVLDANLIKLINLLTVMDKSCLIEEDNDDEENSEEIDFYEEINKLKASNSNLRKISFNKNIDVETFDGLSKYIKSNESEISKLTLNITENTKDLKWLEVASPSSVCIKITKECDESIFYSLESLNNKKKLTIEIEDTASFPNVCSPYLFSFEKLLLSEKLQHLEFKNFLKAYNYVLPYLASIKTLKYFAITDYPLNTKYYPVHLDELNTISEEKIASYDLTFKEIFKAFYNLSTLKELKLSNCNLENFNGVIINPNLFTLNLSNNFISHLDIDVILSNSTKFTNKYTVDLSHNLISSLAFPQIKKFLCENSRCLELNLAYNEIEEEGIIKYARYNLLQNNSILNLNLSGTILIEQVNVLLDIIKKVKQLKKLELVNCNLTNKNLLEVFKAIYGVTNLSIKVLDVSSNLVNDIDTAKSIIMNIKNIKCISSYTINDVFKITNSTKELDIFGLFKNPSIEELFFKNNLIYNSSFTIAGKEANKDFKKLSLLGTSIGSNLISGLELDYLEIEDFKLTSNFANRVKSLNLHLTNKTYYDKLVSLISTVEKLSLFSEDSALFTDLLNATKLFEIKIKSEESSFENQVNINVKNLIAQNIDKSALKVLLNNSLFSPVKAEYSLDNRIINDVNSAIPENFAAPIFDKSMVVIKKYECENIISSNVEDDDFCLLMHENLTNELISYIIRNKNGVISSNELLITNNPYRGFSEGLKYIVLNNNYFDVESFKLIDFKNLEYLELNSVYLKQFLKILKEISNKFKNLKVLVLKDAELNTKELNTLNEIFSKNKDTIVEVHLINTYIDGKESRTMFRGLLDLNNLELLNLSQNYINSVFVDEFIQFNFYKPINKLILRESAISYKNLIKLIKNVKMFEILDISNTHFDNFISATQLPYKIDNTSQYELYIGYSCSNFDIPISSKQEYNISSVILDFVNLNDTKNQLFNLFKNIKVLDCLKIYRCQKENTAFYVLKEMILNTVIKKLDLSFSIINQHNVDDLIEILNNQATLKVIKEIDLSNCQIEDAVFIKLLDCFEENMFSNVKLINNKLSKNSLIVLEKKLNSVKAKCKLAYYDTKHSFSTDFENYSNQKVLSYDLLKSSNNKNLLKNKTEADELNLYNFYLNDRETEFINPMIEKLQNEKDAKFKIQQKIESKDRQGIIEDKNSVSCACVTDSKILVTGNLSGEISIVDIESSKSIETIKFDYAIGSIIDMPNNIIVFSLMNEIKSYNITTKQLFSFETEHTMKITCLTKLDSFRFVSASKDKSITIWTLNRKQSDKKIKDAHTNDILGITSLSETIIASGSRDNFIKIFSLSNLENIQTNSTIQEDASISILRKGKQNNLIYASGNQLKTYNNLKKTIEIITEFENTIIDFVIGKYYTVVSLKNGSNIILNSDNYAIIGSSCTTPSKLNVFYDLNDYICITKNDTITKQKAVVWSEVNKQPHTYHINIIYNLDENRFASGSSDNSIKIWKKYTRECLFTLIGHTDNVLVLCKLNDNTLASGSRDNSIIIWNLDTQERLFTICSHYTWISSICKINEDVFVSSGGGEIKFWQLSTQKCLNTFADSNYITGICLLSNDTFACGSHSDINIFKYDSNYNLNCLLSLSGHSYSILSICKLDEDTIASANEECVKIWSLKNKKCIKTLEEDKKGVYQIIKLSENKFITCLGDSSINIWERKEDNIFKCIASLKKHTDEVHTICKLDEDILASGSDDDTIKLWKISTLECYLTISNHSRTVFSFIELNDDEFATASCDATIKIWRKSTQECLFELKDHVCAVLGLCNIDSERFASCSTDKTIKIWLKSNHSCLYTLKGHDDTVKAICSFDKDTLISGSSDNSIKLWKISTQECIATLDGHTEEVRSLCKVDQIRFASASKDKTIKVWDINSYACLFTLSGHLDKINSVCLQTKNILISGSSDKTIKLWNIDTQICIGTLVGHERNVESIIKLNDDEFASGSSDRTVRIWNFNTLECVIILNNPNDVLSLCKIGEKKIVSGSDCGYLMIWELATQEYQSSIVNEKICLNVKKEISLNDDLIANILDDFSVKITKKSTQECIKTLTGHTGTICILTQIDSDTICSVSQQDKSIRFWSIENESSITYYLKKDVTFVDHTSSSLLLIYSLSSILTVFDMKTKQYKQLKVNITKKDLQEIISKQLPYENTISYLIDKIKELDELDKNNNFGNKEITCYLNNRQDIQIISPSSFGVKWRGLNTYSLLFSYESVVSNTSHIKEFNLPQIKFIQRLKDNILIVGLDNMYVELWDTIKKSRILNIKCRDFVTCAEAISDELLLLGSYRKIYLWSINSKVEIKEIDIGSTAEVVAIYRLDHESIISLDSSDSIIACDIKQTSII